MNPDTPALVVVLLALVPEQLALMLSLVFRRPLPPDHAELLMALCSGNQRTTRTLHRQRQDLLPQSRHATWRGGQQVQFDNSMFSTIFKGLLDRRAAMHPVRPTDSSMYHWRAVMSGIRMGSRNCDQPNSLHGV